MTPLAKSAPLSAEELEQARSDYLDYLKGDPVDPDEAITQIRAESGF